MRKLEKKIGSRNAEMFLADSAMLPIFKKHDNASEEFIDRIRLCAALGNIIANGKCTDKTSTYFVIGIDDLVKINECFGAEAGDAVITEVGQRINDCVNNHGIVGRVGDGHFGVVLPELNEKDALAIGTQVLSTISERAIDTPLQPICVTISIGAVIFPGYARTSSEIMTWGEVALADAYRLGRNCFFSYQTQEEQNEQCRYDMVIGERIQRALREGRITFAYQPVIRNTTMTIEYYECQLRMIDVDGGILTQDELIPVIERIGLIRLFDRYILEKAISEATDNPHVVLGLNLSKFATTDNAWPDAIIEKLRERPDIASRLIFEFRDIGIMQNSEECVRLLGMLREFGCRIVFDDITSSFGSFRDFYAFGTDAVMIGNAITRNLIAKNTNLVFLRHLISLARNIGILTIATGVDSKQDALILRQEGVEFLQGEYFGGPTLVRPWIASQEAKQESSAALREGCQ